MKPPYAPNVVNQTVSYGGITWKGNPGSDWTPETPSGGGGGNVDPVATFKALAAAQAELNKPAISQLQQRQTDLPGQYQQLLAEIKGEFQPLINQQTQKTNTLLGQRGIYDTTSPLYQQQQIDALSPIYGQLAGVSANAQTNQINDLNTIAQNIAQLQSGANAGALSAAGGLGQSQISANSAIQQAQIQAANQLAVQQAANQNALAIARLQQQYKTIDPNQFLVNTVGNSWLNPSQLMQATGYAAGRF